MNKLNPPESSLGLGISVGCSTSKLGDITFPSASLLGLGTGKDISLGSINLLVLFCHPSKNLLFSEIRWCQI